MCVCVCLCVCVCVCVCMRACVRACVCGVHMIEREFCCEICQIVQVDPTSEEALPGITGLAEELRVRYTLS